MAQSTTTPARDAAHGGEAARRGPGFDHLSRKGWKTLAIPEELYETVQALVPKHAKSVNAYAHFWIRLGTLIDKAIADADPDADLASRVLVALNTMDRNIGSAD